MNLKTVFCTICGTIIALLCSLDRFLPVMLWVITFSSLDFITGIIKARLQHNISSRRAFDGFWRKVATLCALFLGILLDFALPSLVGSADYAVLSTGVIFSSFIGFYIVVCEAISIVENLYECSVPLPEFIIKFLKVCKDKIEQEGGDNH